MRFTPEKCCPRCHAPRALCYCALLPVIDSDTRVSIIVHRSEFCRATATANTAHLCLPNSRVFPYGRAEESFDMEALLSIPGNALYLFPEPYAETLDVTLATAIPRPIHLIVPDGSWAQAKRIHRRVPALHAIRIVQLPPQGVSRYQLRYAHEEHQLCTLEAIAAALGVIEGAAIQQGLQGALEIQVERMKGKRPRFTNRAE
ncbi:MAG: DTW domain-containing protein [Spirochaetota bacterium]|jgi:DTW domain-containing protein YfiP|nr:DTW domain-containing protein [Spirochaetota bacterium]